MYITRSSIPFSTTCTYLFCLRKIEHFCRTRIMFFAFWNTYRYICYTRISKKYQPCPCHTKSTWWKVLLSRKRGVATINRNLSCWVILCWLMPIWGICTVYIPVFRLLKKYLKVRKSQIWFYDFRTFCLDTLFNGPEIN